MDKNIFRNKSFQFAIKIVTSYKFLVEEKKEYVLSKQLLRSGTAVGALHREAENAESKNDFIHKMAIAQKECNETTYWLELLFATNYFNKTQFEDLYKDAIELLKLCTAIIMSSKKLTTNN